MVLEKGNISNDFKRWFKSYIRNAKYREISDSSLLVYNRIITNLEDYIKTQDEVDSIKEIDKEFILSFLESLEESSKSKKFSTKTKTLYISILKSFFMYISSNNDEFYTYENEFKGIMPKKTKRNKKIKYLSDSDVGKILDYLEKNLSTEKHYSYLHSLGVKLMLFAGLRISEALSLKVEDINISDLTDSSGERDFYEIFLKNTKSQEEQTALIKIELIKKELKYFRTLDSEYIFQGKKSTTKINRTNFYTSISKIMEKLNIRSRGLHIFRHTCAMQLYRKTGNILVLKETLRHADIKTTMIYAHAEKRDIADAMR